MIIYNQFKDRTNKKEREVKIMGTRSTVKFYRKGRCLLALYNQYDGYLEGVGQEIVEFLESDNSKANGFEDMALLYVCYKKQGKPYHTYLTTERDYEEFNYIIEDTDEGLRFSIVEEIWLGEEQTVAYKPTLRWATFEEFKKYVKKEGEDNE